MSPIDQFQKVDKVDNMNLFVEMLADPSLTD